VLYSLITDLIVGEVKCSECLQRTVSERKNKKKSGTSHFTLFCSKALARRSAP
jgi:hypothetical protein